jgi:hypothetical protein
MRRAGMGAAALAVVAMALGAGLAAGPARAGKDAVGVGPVFVPPLVLQDQTAATSAAAAAARAAEEVTLARDFCRRLAQKEYVIDCLAAEIGAVADRMPDDPTLAPAKAALSDASRKLGRIVEANRSTTLKPGVARASGRSSPRALRPVETARLDVATDAAIGVIEETGTILLRSSETSDEAAGFVAISTAVTSNTLLLRSI